MNQQLDTESSSKSYIDQSYLDESDAARILKEKDCVKRANFAPEEVTESGFVKFCRNFAKHWQVPYGS